MKQTAVDLMFNRALLVLPMGAIDAMQRLEETYEQAKQMEKQQIIETARFYFHDRGNATPEQYYNQEYGGEQ